MKKHLICSFVFVTFLLITVAEAQQSEEFPIGAFVNERYNEDVYNSIIESGLNTIVNSANENTKEILSGLNVIALNNSPQDWIYHYSTAYYSKWEAEENQLDTHRVGVKHLWGQSAVWKGKSTWSTVGLTSPVCSLMYGPHYAQEKRYKRDYLGISNENLQYTASFRMALDYDPQTLNPNDTVCVIKAVYRYAEIYPSGSSPGWTVHDTVMTERVLKVSDFNSDGTFKDFTLNQYSYPSKYYHREDAGKFESIPVSSDTTYSDTNGDNGIQFWVDWNGIGTLYIDYAEVYDNFGWNAYIENPNAVSDTIKSYAQSYSDWENLKYWYGHDEPYTIDAFVPMRIVDSLIRSVGAPPIITVFYPRWYLMNGENLIEWYYNIAQPQTLMIDYYPIAVNTDISYALEGLRSVLSEAHDLQPGFWYTGQSYGVLDESDNWCSWRKPDSTELKAMVMLALSHGVKGILFWNYDSYKSSRWKQCNNDIVSFDCIIDTNYNPTELWYVIKENIAPRLRGTLGNTLLNLDYTGNYLHILHSVPTEGNPATFDYLTIGNNPSFETKNWFAGLLKDKVNSDNNYFLLTNSITDAAKTINVSLTPPVTGYYNYSFRDVEGSFDTSFTTSFSKNLTYPAGEGLLFQVSPVIKYGGKIITNDTITTNISLTDNMILYDTVFISENKLYNINSDIDLQTNGFITGNGYITTDSGFTVTTNNWSRALLKGKQGDNPRLFWAAHPTLSGIINYKIYRKKESQTFELIATVSGTTYTYVDTTVNIVSGATQQNETIAEYYIKCTYQGDRGNSESSASNTIKYHRVSGSPPQKSGQGDEASIVYTYNLEQNYPNPFNPTTTINYEVAPKNGNSALVQIKVFDILGKEIATLVNEEKQEGRYSVNFDASHLSNGVYFYSMKSGDPSTSSGQSYFSVKKMILLK